MSELVTFNIGGSLFTTEIKTIHTYRSMLSTLLNSDLSSKKDQNGNIFIDRDPTYFRYIINYFRGIISYPTKLEKLLELYCEVDFYCLEEYKQLIESEIEIAKEKDISKKQETKSVKETTNLLGKIAQNIDNNVCNLFLYLYKKHIGILHSYENKLSMINSPIMPFK